MTVQNSFAQSPMQEFWALNQNAAFILDQTASANASVAYSVRKLKKNYSGFSMRVRRSGDNAVGDVSFNSANVVAATSTITITSAGTSGLTVGSSLTFSTFYSGRSVFVVTWYDQSGNARHVTQTTASQQPRIVNAGTLEVAGTSSRSSLRFINSSSTLLQATIGASTMFASGITGSASLVMEPSSGSTSAFGYSDGGSNRWQAHMNESSSLHFDVGNSYSRLTTTNSSNVGLLRNYLLITGGTSSMQIFISGTSVASSTPTLTAATTNIFNIGGIPLFPGTWYHNDHISEVVIFNKALSSAEIAIVQRSQSQFYGTP